MAYRIALTCLPRGSYEKSKLSMTLLAQLQFTGQSADRLALRDLDIYRHWTNRIATHLAANPDGPQGQVNSNTAATFEFHSVSGSAPTGPTIAIQATDTKSLRPNRLLPPFWEALFSDEIPVVPIQPQ